MNVFTATFYKNNYGSALQAVALQKKLKELGADSVIMTPPHILSKKKKSILTKLTLFFRPEKHYGPIRKMQRYIQQKIYNEKGKKILRFVENHTVIKPYQQCFEEAANGDSVMLAGSDQVWNILNHPIPDFYLFKDEKLKDVPKVSYAASIGISDLSSEQVQYYQKALRHFDAVSFRERVAYNTLKDTLENAVVRQDVDPTLLFPGDFWEQFATEKIHEKPYIFIYMLRPNPEVIRTAKALAKSKGLDILYMGLYVNRYQGIRTIPDGGVEEFLSCIRNAEMVVTNSFHGTVFSILFQKRFVSLRLEGTSSRVENLLELTGLTNHLIDSAQQAKIAEQDYDCHTVAERLAEARKSSVEYLTEIISRYQ